VTATGAAVSITVEPQFDGDLVVFASPARKKPIELTLPTDTLSRARADVSSHITEFKEKVGSNPRRDVDNVRAAFTRLFETMCMVASHLTQQGSAGLDELREFFEDAMPDWREAEDDDEVPLIHVEGPIDGFPFEWLPILDFDDPGSVEDIELFARRFLGFSAVVRRAAMVRRAGGDPGLAVGQSLRNKDRLPLTFAWFATMKGAQKECDFFKRMGDHIELNGPWPTESLSTKSVLDSLTEVLFDPRRRFTTQEGEAIQIAHFACHCDTGFPAPVDYELILAGSDGNRRPVPMGKLNTGFLGRQKGQRKFPRPLVFLNACESAKQDSAHVFSWPEWFLAERHVGVIGTETLVPDRVAARYAELFYTALLSGRKLGESLVVARRQLLREGNPLGLLYVLYADPDMTVENPVPRETLHG
jgi:hypothetical protein